MRCASVLWRIEPGADWTDFETRRSAVDSVAEVAVGAAGCDRGRICKERETFRLHTVTNFGLADVSGVTPNHGVAPDHAVRREGAVAPDDPFGQGRLLLAQERPGPGQALLQAVA